MRNSKQRTNVARLRVLLDKLGAGFGKRFDQGKFAKLIGCETQKLKNIESGRTPLDELLARRISDETGITVEWLLENNAKAPPVSNVVTVGPDRGGRITLKAIRRAQAMCGRAPFTFDTYKSVRLHRELGFSDPREQRARDYSPLFAIIFYAWMRAIFFTKHADTVMWKTQKFLEGLASEYGHNLDILPTPRLELALRKEQEQWAKIGIKLADEFARKWQQPPPKSKSKRPSKHQRR